MTRKEKKRRRGKSEKQQRTEEKIGFLCFCPFFSLSFFLSRLFITYLRLFTRDNTQSHIFHFAREGERTRKEEREEVNFSSSVSSHRSFFPPFEDDDDEKKTKKRLKNMSNEIIFVYSDAVRQACKSYGLDSREFLDELMRHEAHVKRKFHQNNGGEHAFNETVSAQKYWWDVIKNMKIPQTTKCLKDTGAENVTSTLRAKELQRLVFLCAVAKSAAGSGEWTSGRFEEGMTKKLFRYFPERVREWLAMHHGTITGRRVEVREYRESPIPSEFQNIHDILESATQMQSRFQQIGDEMIVQLRRQQEQREHQQQAPSSLSPAASKLSRAEKSIHDTLERALNSDPYFALVSPTSFNPTRPNGVVAKPTKLVFTKANSRSVVNFELTPIQEQFLRENSKTAQLRAYSVLIKEDEAKAKNRVLWPNDCVMHVNGVNVDVTRRSSSQKVTKSTRERPALISNARGVNLRAGQNTMRIMGVDARHFALCILLVRERTDKEVRALIPPPKEFDHYVSSLKKSLGFSDQDEEDDDIIGPDTAIISVRCPIRMCMMETPARLENCNQACAFDADSFLEMHKETRKWTCPCCGSAGGPKDVRIDGFLVRVMAKLNSDLRHKRINPSSASVSRIEIDKDCRWRYREAAGDKQELGEWVDIAETRAVELSIQGRAIASAEEGVALEGKNTSTRNNKRSSGMTSAKEVEIVISEEEERKKPKRDNTNVVAADDDYDSEEELRNACREAAAMRGNGGAKDTVPDIIVIDDSDSEDDVRIVGSTSGAAPAQPPHSVVARKAAVTPMQQLRDLHRLRNAAEEEQRRHQREREREAHQNDGTQPWQREILQQAQARNGRVPVIRAAAEARQRAERLESERRVKEHEERLRQQRINAMHNGRSEYERSVMANAQAQPFGLQPQYYHNANNMAPQPPPPQPPPRPYVPLQNGDGGLGVVPPVLGFGSPYQPPPPRPLRHTQQQQQQPPHQSVRFVFRPPNPATTRSNTQK